VSLSRQGGIPRPEAAALDERVQRSSREWALLRARLRTITPRSLGRGLLATAVVAITAWLAIGTWPTLMPYAFAGILAYAVFPLVGRLDRYMPRLLAASIAMAVAVGIVVGVLAIIVPPLVEQAIAMLTGLPSSGELDRLREQTNAYLATLPDAARVLVRGVLDRMAAQFGAGLAGLMDGIATFLVENTLQIFGTLGNLLGALLLPIWALYVVRDGKGISRSIERVLAPAIKTDVMALLRIVDRAVSSFLRVQLAAAFLVSLGVYLGLALVERAGIATFNSELAISAFAGVVQVVPQVGWLIGLIPAVIPVITRPEAPTVPLTYLVIYLLSVRAVQLTVGQRLGRVLNVRASLAIPGIVLLSAISVGWLLLSAPILVIFRDTILYLRGRLGEPPAPAGVLPGEPGRQAAVSRRVALPVPPLYRPLVGFERGQGTPPRAAPTPALTTVIPAPAGGEPQ
jgi:predicted PurR-regulated permease PerM